MELITLSLSDLMANLDKSILDAIIKSFKGFDNGTSTPHDVEVFLHDKAVQFEKIGLSTTYLVFSSETFDLLGFFSLANRPLTFFGQNYQQLSTTKRKRFAQSGYTLDDPQGLLVSSYLIGQLGKNYANLDKQISGKKLLSIAYDRLKLVSSIISTKYIWLECDDNPALINFYQSFGFSVIDNFQSENNLKVLVMKI